MWIWLVFTRYEHFVTNHQFFQCVHMHWFHIFFRAYERCSHDIIVSCIWRIWTHVKTKHNAFHFRLMILCFAVILGYICDWELRRRRTALQFPFIIICTTRPDTEMNWKKLQKGTRKTTKNHKSNQSSQIIVMQHVRCVQNVLKNEQLNIFEISYDRVLFMRVATMCSNVDICSVFIRMSTKIWYSHDMNIEHVCDKNFVKIEDMKNDDIVWT